jgi:4-amino-4-deoxy-L-arabinose transferase-like glycosyltransferase
VRRAGVPLTHRLEALVAGLLFVAGALVRLALSSRTTITGDAPRFLAQARHLAAGAVGLIPGDPFSAVPPGYPLFIRIVGWIAPGIEGLLRVQLLLSVLTLLFVWLAARRKSREGALVALALLALNPWLARQQALVMSETLGAFLVAVTILRWRRRRPRSSPFLPWASWPGRTVAAPA